MEGKEAVESPNVGRIVGRARVFKHLQSLECRWLTVRNLSAEDSRCGHCVSLEENDAKGGLEVRVVVLRDTAFCS